MKVDNILIKRIGELRSGISQSTGNSWANRNILLAWEDETGESYLNAIVDEKVWDSLGYQEGAIATLNLRFRTQAKASGYIINDIRIVKAEGLTAEG